jgi:hypothetical protein
LLLFCDALVEEEGKRTVLKENKNTYDVNISHRGLCSKIKHRRKKAPPYEKSTMEDAILPPCSLQPLFSHLKF